MATVVELTVENPLEEKTPTNRHNYKPSSSSAANRSSSTNKFNRSSSLSSSLSGPKQRIKDRLNQVWWIVLSVLLLEVINFIAATIYPDINKYTWHAALTGYLIGMFVIIYLFATNTELLSRPVFFRLLLEPNVLLSLVCVLINIAIDFTKWQKGTHVTGKDREKWLCTENDTCAMPIVNTIGYLVGFILAILMDPIRFPFRRLQSIVIICFTFVTVVNYISIAFKLVNYPDFPLFYLDSSGRNSSIIYFREKKTGNTTEMYNDTSTKLPNSDNIPRFVSVYSVKSTCYSIIVAGMLEAVVIAVTDCKGKKLMFVKEPVLRDDVAVPETPRRATEDGVSLKNENKEGRRSKRDAVLQTNSIDHLMSYNNNRNANKKKMKK